jgi:ArsR family transcriptional regulator, arsenate/arsenite/antimonite-responsive transcriptional repressor
MGASKTDIYSAKQNKMATLVKALGHPARLAIIDYLLKVNTCICSDIVNEISLAQPTISQHLKELKNVGLIKGTVDGNAICYCIDEKVWNEVLTYFNKISQKLAIKNTSCC